MKFDLQRFDDAPAPEPAPEPTPEPTPEPQTDEVQKRIDEATKKLKAELETERKKREADAKREADRLSKLSDDERAKAELESTRKELESQRAEFEREKLKYEAAKVLSQRGLPVEFTDYLIAEDNAKTLERITTFEKAFKKSVEAAVNERLKSKPPAAGGRNIDAGGNVSNSFMDAIRKNQIRR